MKIIKPQKDINNTLYYIIGLGIIFLNFIRHNIYGYKKPRDFSIKETERAIEYDFRVVEGWSKYLSDYVVQTNPFHNKTILELGPGPDLGIGLILLAKGAKKYIAIDVCPLARGTPKEFYSRLLDVIKKKIHNCDIEYLKVQIDRCYKGKDSDIMYIVDKRFDILNIKEKIDLVVSQATFEYFSNVEKTFKELSQIVRKGGYMVSEIDLQTHTSFIRNRDPLNIYRYNDFLWNLFRTKYSLNRVRAFEYKKILEKYGWHNVKVEPLRVLEKDYVEKIRPFLSKKYRKVDIEELKLLSIMLLAKKA